MIGGVNSENFRVVIINSRKLIRSFQLLRPGVVPKPLMLLLSYKCKSISKRLFKLVFYYLFEESFGE